MSSTLLQQSPTLLTALVFLVGLIIGSFLNVVIYRLPLMLQANWKQQCHEYLQMPLVADNKPINLMLPGSHCPTCKTPVKPWHNIPLLSYVLLRGKCAYCHSSIPLRYPLVELLTAGSSALLAWHFGYTTALPFALLLTWGLISLSFIDIDTQLLPDEITQPLLWLGLLLSMFQVFANSSDSITGAVAGYLSLWSVYQGFKLATGKEGMGQGDFKLLAMLGAWLGWQYLPLIILLSSLSGAIIGVSLIVLGGRDAQQPMPFGQYLALAGWVSMIWGEQLNEVYLKFSGFG